MAGRYVFTPARRAALKRAAAKSAAKRRVNSGKRKAYRNSNRVAAGQINEKYRKGHYGGAVDQLTTGRPLRRAKRDYALAKHKNAVRHKGKKRLSDKSVIRRHRAKNAAKTAAIVIGPTAVQYAIIAGRKHNSEYSKISRANKKASKAKYKQDKKQSLKARRTNLKRAGLNNQGTYAGRRRTPTRVTSHRLPGQAMIGSGR